VKKMKTITTSRVFLFGSSVAMMVVGLAGTASAITAVPEIDPATATSGLALLAGAVLLLIERRGLRRR
jgi:hypothetical protein